MNEHTRLLDALIEATVFESCLYQEQQNSLARTSSANYVDIKKFGTNLSRKLENCKFIDVSENVKDVLERENLLKNSTLIWFTPEYPIAAALLCRRLPNLRIIVLSNACVAAVSVARALRTIDPGAASRFQIDHNPGVASDLVDRIRAEGRSPVAVVDMAHPLFSAERQSKIRVSWEELIDSTDAVYTFAVGAAPDVPEMNGRLVGAGKYGTISYQLRAPIKPMHAPFKVPARSETLHGTKVVVVGSNLAGLSAAYDLQRRGAQVVLTEKGRSVGRTCSTFRIGPCLADFGEHLFPVHIPEATAFWHDILGAEFQPLYYRLGIATVLGTIPVVQDARMLGFCLGRGHLEAYLRSREAGFTEADALPRSWGAAREIVGANGRWYFDIFVGDYYRRRNNRDWDTLDRGTVAAAIRPLAAAELADQHFLEGNLCDEDQGRGERVTDYLEYLGAVQHAIEADWHWKNFSRSVRPAEIVGSYYPRLGCGQMSEAIRASFERLDGDLRLNQAVAALHHDGDRALGVRLASGEQFDADWILAADVQEVAEVVGGKGAAVGSVQKAPAIGFVVLLIEKPDVFPYTTISVADPASKVLRVTNFRNWSRSMTNDARFSCIGFEFRHTPWSDLTEWGSMSNEQICDYAISELARFGYDIRNFVRESRVVKVPTKASVDTSRLKQFKNVIPLTATNLAGTTAEGLKVAASIAGA